MSEQGRRVAASWSGTGRGVSVFSLLVSASGKDFFIGSHLAELLKRETFNLYGSLKRREIGTWHVDDNLLKLLVSKGRSLSVCNCTRPRVVRVSFFRAHAGLLQEPCIRGQHR